MKYPIRKVGIIAIAVLLTLGAYFSRNSQPVQAPAPEQAQQAKIKPVEPVKVAEAKTIAPKPKVVTVTATAPDRAKLVAFMDRYHCLETDQVDQYLASASKHGIDWRLLPAISLAESSCGKHYINNNLWGWESARKHFNSFAEGIEFISMQLGEGRYYAGKTTDQKLRTYNTNPAYATRVESYMNQISK